MAEGDSDIDIEAFDEEELLLSQTLDELDKAPPPSKSVRALEAAVISQASSSQRSQAIVQSRRDLPGPSKVNVRGRRKEIPQKNVKKPEPGVGAPIDISKKKVQMLESLRSAELMRRVMNMKLCWQPNILDKVQDCPNVYDLVEMADIIKDSATVYSFRVENTYNEAYNTHCHLVPALASLGILEGNRAPLKRSKAEKKAELAAELASENMKNLLEIRHDEDFVGEDDASSTARAPSEDGPLMGDEPTADELPSTNEHAPDMDSDNEMGHGAMEGQREKEMDREMDEDEIVVPIVTDEKDEGALNTDQMKYYENMYYGDVIKEAERRISALISSRGLGNTLIEDDEKYKITPAPIMHNEYYQIATSRYKEHNAGGLLLYNAKCSDNGRMTLMHRRMDTMADSEATEFTMPKPDFVRTVSGLFDNALSEVPKEIPNWLFPEADCNIRAASTALDGGLAEIERRAREEAMQIEHDLEGGDSPEVVEEIEKETEDTERIEEGEKEGGEGQKERLEVNEEGERETPMEGEQSATRELESRSTSNPPTRKAKESFGGISEVLAEDSLTLPFDLPFSAGNAAHFLQILTNKLEEGSEAKWGKGQVAEELEAELTEISEDTLAVEAAGVDDDLRDLDNMWNAEFVRKRVTEEEHERMLYDKDNDDAMSVTSDAHRLGRRKLIVAAGDYEILVEPDVVKVPIPADELSHLVLDDQPLMRQQEEQEAFDDFDFGGDMGGDDEMVVSEPVAIDEDGDEASGTGLDEMLEDPLARLKKKIEKKPEEETADVAPVDQIINPADVVTNNEPSQAVTKVGKQDDSHWKLAPSHPDNVKEKPAKEKKKKEKENDPENDYFSLQRSTVSRFQMVDNARDLLKPLSEIQLPEPTDTDVMVPQESFPLEKFFASYTIPEHRIGRFNLKHAKVTEKTADISRKAADQFLMQTYGRQLKQQQQENEETVYVNMLQFFQGIYTLENADAMEEEGMANNDIERRLSGLGMERNDDVMGDSFGGDPRYDGMDDHPYDMDGDNSAFFLTPGKQKPFRPLFPYDFNNDGDSDDEDVAQQAVVLGTKYNLKQIKLDTVAMKHALSDVLTNPMMAPNKLEETLCHFDRLIPKLPQNQNQAEREKEEEILREAISNFDMDSSVIECPNVLEVTRALLAPPQECARPDITTMYRDASPVHDDEDLAERMNRSLNKSQEMTNIDLQGRHTLKSTFTCLPARLPPNNRGEVTVASTIAMILHLANENNLNLAQPEQQQLNRSTFHNWMADFEVLAEGEEEVDVTMRDAMNGGNNAPTFDVLAAIDDTEEEEERRREMMKEEAQRQAEQRRKEKQTEERRRRTGDVVMLEDDEQESRPTASASIINVEEEEEEERVTRKRVSPRKAVQSVQQRLSGSISPSSKRSRGGNKTIIVSDDDDE